MIVDEVKISVKAGNGGNGGVFFRREKFIPKGGPDGGDGGNGGSVYILASRHVDDLTQYARKAFYEAENGGKGMKQKMSGKNGSDLVLEVPLGAQVFENNILLHDMVNDGQKVLIAQGGNGGWGNQHFATSIKQAPMWAKDGLPGEAKSLRLELKMIADIGIVGLPNAGKSTLLSVLSNARPKIADYPFTTLEPNLGAIRYENKTLIIADIPGLIEGASKGKGLGHKFLKHIDRTKMLIHLLSAEDDNVIKSYQLIRNELKEFSDKLGQKPELVVLNKIELLSKEELQKVSRQLKNKKIKFLAVSAVTQENIKDLKYMLYNKVS